ncbi:hypothetical protein HanLR1_Chr02g0043921 [Helianthus annuus]|nr:hypothetical protein HanLR1_Chr02g0043921 [Helianthus annuus]
MPWPSKNPSRSSVSCSVDNSLVISCGDGDITLTGDSSSCFSISRFEETVVTSCLSLRDIAYHQRSRASFSFPA